MSVPRFFHRLFAGGFLSLFLLVAAPVGSAGADLEGEVALLQGLDKVTARISTFEAPVGDIVTFGTLEIYARACYKRPPEEPPESAAFLDVRDVKPGETPESLFAGWMFASSPALSALEHPVYDVWVIDCLVGAAPLEDESLEGDASPRTSSGN